MYKSLVNIRAKTLPRQRIDWAISHELRLLRRPGDYGSILRLKMAGGTWMNTGEGGLSPYHLKGGADIICQIGPGLFGVRTEDGAFSFEEFKKKRARGSQSL